MTSIDDAKKWVKEATINLEQATAALVKAQQEKQDTDAMRLLKGEFVPFDYTYDKGNDWFYSDMPSGMKNSQVGIENGYVVLKFPHWSTLSAAEALLRRCK